MGMASGSEQWRSEYDSMGEVLVPEGAMWGAQTQRAVENFQVSGRGIDPGILRALALLKRAAAVVNGRMGVIAKEVAEALADAAAEVAEGRYGEQFPVDVYQTGSGTSTNMNMNEVLARLAGRRLGREIRPNAEPNASQSSNDVFPSAIHLAATEAVAYRLVPALERLGERLEERSFAFSGVVKAGRTHLMDATPVTLGQEFAGYATQVQKGAARMRATLACLGELPLGGTAVGTGLNAPAGFAAQAIAELAGELGLPLREAGDHFEAQGARDGLVEASGALRVVAVSLYKIANDLRLIQSGPNCGLGEIALPELQPGSSIMPGKVNPVVPEAVCQVVARVIGNDATVAFAASAGSLELNVMLPVMGQSMLESIGLLAAAADLLASKCISGITANAKRCREYALSSPALVTALNPHIGYEAAARVVKRAMAERRDIRSVILEEELLSEEDVDRVLDVDSMAAGGMLL